MWADKRKVVISNFPATENIYTSIESCIKQIEIHYEEDAYSSLSIEGYKVIDNLIEKVNSGEKNLEKTILI